MDYPGKSYSAPHCDKRYFYSWHIVTALWRRWRWRLVVRRTTIFGLFVRCSAPGEEERGQDLMQENKKINLFFPSTIPHVHWLILYIWFHILFVWFFFFIFSPFVFLLLKSNIHLLRTHKYCRVPQCALYSVYFSSSSGLSKSIYTVSSSQSLPPCRCDLHCYYIVRNVESSLPSRNRHFIHSFIFKTCFLFGASRWSL